jgi:Dolichyl-phosphate-mannose-protein mannosyltransferase
MDDVDAVQGQIARNMLDSGDWVTAKLDGVKYLEKAPLWYWMMAICFKFFGVHDWAARIPVVLSCVLLSWLTARIGRWAFSREAGFYAGLAIATCVGLFLFTRILIPDVCLTLFIALSLWAFLRTLDEEERHSRLWAAVFPISIAIGILLKGLIAALFPVGIALIYLLITGTWRERSTWRKLHVGSGVLIVLALAAPWHVIATMRNPPYFVATLHSGPGEYKGFLWFYFVNEHVLRFLNTRYPRDYNTVPRLMFWLLHLAWLYPWGLFLSLSFRLRYGNRNRAERVRLLALIWIGFVLVFFTFSTTQEYYSMPCYPAFALLIGCSIAAQKEKARWPWRVVTFTAAVGWVATAALLIATYNLPHPADISRALTQHPDAYSLSLGHLGDLTLSSFAYLHWPLGLASLAFAIGAVGGFFGRRWTAYMSLTTMMVILLGAARLAMVTFDPYLSSRPLAVVLLHSPPGQVIFDDQYYTFSSVVFYTNKKVLLLDGRVTNLEYGSNSPDTPNVFIDDNDLVRQWAEPARYYLFAEQTAIPRLRRLLGAERLRLVAESGGKYLFTNVT